MSPGFRTYNASWCLFMHLKGTAVRFGALIDTPSESFPTDSTMKVSWASMREEFDESVEEYLCHFESYFPTEQYTFCSPHQQTLPLHDMLRGAIPGSPFLVKGELLFSVVLTPLKLNGSFQSALDAPPGLAHAASPLLRRWAYKHMPRDRRASWGSEGFPSRRLPDTPGDECATLGQASLCLFDAYASLAKGDEACSACGGSCAAEPAASSRREDSGDEADMTLSEVVAKAKQTLARRQRAEELAWWEAALALLWLYLLFRTLRWVLRRLGVGSARAGVKRLVWPAVWLGRQPFVLLHRRSRAAALRRQLEKAAAKQQKQQQQKRGGGTSAGGSHQHPRQLTAGKQGGKQQSKKPGGAPQQKGAAMQRRAKAASSTAQLQLPTASSSPAGGEGPHQAACQPEAQAAEVAASAAASSTPQTCTTTEAGLSQPVGAAPASPPPGQAGPSSSEPSTGSQGSNSPSSSDNETEPASLDSR